MGALVDYDREGTATLDAFPLTCPAWTVQGNEDGTLGLMQLWATFAVRGEDRLIPAAPGVVPFRRRLAPTRHDLRLIVIGDVTQTGTPNADAYEGLFVNVQALDVNVFTPPVSPVTRTLTVGTPDGGSISGEIHSIGAQLQRSGFLENGGQAFIEYTWQIEIPGGRLS